MQLPERPFSKPMARALVEQRRLLALDGDTQASVLNALDALTLAPERFNIESSVYLGLRAIYWQLSRAKSDDQLREVVARMWDMAVHLEDGSVSDAEQALRAAEEALRQALERGATDEEIKKLTDQLRAALDKFLQALAEQMRKNPQQLARPLDPNMRQLRPQDLQQHDRPSRADGPLRRKGCGAAHVARAAIDAGKSANGASRTTNGQRRGRRHDVGAGRAWRHDPQAAAIARSHLPAGSGSAAGPPARAARPTRSAGSEGDQMGDLRGNQQALRDQLKKLMEELRKRGFGQGQQGQGEMDQFGRAGEAMGEAEGELGEGNADGAVESQGRAIEALRRGAQNLAQSMQQQGMMGPGPNGQPGRLGQGRAQQETDPLGRPLRGRDYGDDTTVRVPGEIDVQRARRILEELRRRFGESFRPQLELDYIERLLRDY